MFWDRFIELCSEHNTKPNPVAKELGLSSGSVTKWKKSGAIPNSVTLQKIADYFSVSINYLLGNTDEKKPAQDWKQGTGLPDILYRFSELSDSRQKEVVAFVEFKLAQQEKDNS